MILVLKVQVSDTREDAICTDAGYQISCIFFLHRI